MAGSKHLDIAAVASVGDLVDDSAGVQLSALPPFTTLLIWTVNSLYRVVVTQWPEVYVQGGDFFPDPTLAQVNTTSAGANRFRVGWISDGLVVQVGSGGRRIVTSPVVAITTEAANAVVH